MLEAVSFYISNCPSDNNCIFIIFNQNIVYTGAKIRAIEMGKLMIIIWTCGTHCPLKRSVVGL